MSHRTSPADDAFHAVTTDDPAWIETVWFPFWLPKRRISVYVRLVVRPNAGAWQAAVAIWRADGEMLADAGFEESISSIEDLGDLRELTLPCGLGLECLEPLQRYRIAFAGGDCELEVQFDALMPPYAPAADHSPGMYEGHLDQPGRVTGHIQLGDERLVVDCYSIRDRSWGPRRLASDLRLGNAHGTAAEEAFFFYLQADAQGQDRVRGGYLWRDGVSADLCEGGRETHWRDDHPWAVRLWARDTLGRSIDVQGECLNRRLVAAGDDVYAILNLVRWTADGGSSWGENHEVWSREAWLDAGRKPLET